MVGGWKTYEIKLSCFMLLAVLSEIQQCCSLDLQGLALMEFHERINDDPYGALSNWNLNQTEPCLWSGVHCMDGKVQMLNLSGFSLQGTLSPGLRKLRFMRSLMLSTNRLSGSIPKEFGELKLLESLDLRFNNLTGTIPLEIRGLPSLKCLLLVGNNFHGGFPNEVEKLDLHIEHPYDQNLKSDAAVVNRDIYKKNGRRCLTYSTSNFLTIIINLLHLRNDIGNDLFCADGENCSHNSSGQAEETAGRQLLVKANNLRAAPSNSDKSFGHNDSVIRTGALTVLRTGAFPVLMSDPPPPPLNLFPHISHQQPAKDGFFIRALVITISTAGLVFIFLLGFLLIPRYTIAKARRAQKAVLLQRLSKVFVTGVPKLDFLELESACEEFSNVVDSYPGCLVHKGILSSGVEIAVVSSTISSFVHWPDRLQKKFEKKIEDLSRVNHKNFVNLLGYCEDDHAFVRVMVFEYAPNGKLHERLHGEDPEHLDWLSRMRIIMGIAYCLEHMHHELNPPFVLQILRADTILLTDNNAAKIAEMSFWSESLTKEQNSDEELGCPCSDHPSPSLEDNVYSFGVLLLEIIMGRSLSNGASVDMTWAAEYLSDEKKQSCLVDPNLKSFKKKELEIVCEVILECIVDDAGQRPTMKETTAKLKAVLNISPEAATSRMSPLWWAELELLSIEST
ncbi:hypothetical protein Nepgr_027416 [Nepenthes gracilis]|uniref:Protein kinase domain-containing protein n=1 Tax=Nepenthes gracilis TaxID=150966 RepID=A0AAD3Y1F7_NEPGR|nr:hypothetical protein Nepgr_027416 [Nepenthes gracilis]